MRWLILALILILPFSAGATARADASASLFCETAIAGAERAADLPARMMSAIALTESGRFDATTGRVRPWPWTINVEGAGQYFATREQAVAAVTALLARGVRSIDVGCMQVNLAHHPRAFATIEDAFDPAANAAYAARFLASLFQEYLHWPKAIAAYHSRTPALGNAYLELVMARWQGADPAALRGVRPVYGAFARTGGAYGAFADPARSYAAFTPARR
jgi:hypothetical protein